MKYAINLIWIILYVAAMIAGILACIMFPVRWYMMGEVNMDELSFMFIIAILIIAIFILARNGGTIEPFEDHSVIHEL